MKRLILFVLLALCFAVALPLYVFAASASAEQSLYPTLPKPGKKVTIDRNYYFVYGFNKPPKLGLPIMRVEIFDKNGIRDTSFTVKGEADMPSMRGTHSTGAQYFTVSDKGVYLLPVSLGMPGEWDFRFFFIKGGRMMLQGAYPFHL